MKKLIFFLCLLWTVSSYGQKLLIIGQVNDSASNSAIPQATVVLKSDSFQTAVVTNPNGFFSFPNLKKGTYHLEISFISYNNFSTDITLVDKTINLGKIKLSPSDLKLSEIEVVGHITPVAQKGDTTEMSAQAYKVNTDADAMDLVKKMPGVTIENGQVKAHGENIKKVLVDGKEFFGNDASLSLQNLPADMIDKVQIYNKLSDQSQFIGFDDGNSDKVMNIVTRGDRKVGQNGKVIAGAGLDMDYQVVGRWNFTNKKNNITVSGGSNNVNQQNYIQEGGNTFQGGGGGGGDRGGFSGRMSGLNTTHTLGTNYSGTLGSKVNLNVSYFFNMQDNYTNKISNKAYFGDIDTLFQARYEDQGDSTNQINQNHRLNLFLEYNIDTLNAITYRQNLSFQTSDINSLVNALKYNQITEPFLSSLSENSSNNYSFNYSGNLVYRHKFMKKGRTFSIGLQYSGSNQDIDNTNISSVQNFSGVTDMNQLSNTGTNNRSYSSNIMYTEPINNNFLLMFSYNTGINPGKSDKYVYDNLVDPPVLLDSISNDLTSNYITQRGGFSLLIQKEKKLNASIGIEYQDADLKGEQIYPELGQVDRTFRNFLPNARLNFKINKLINLRANYRTSTYAPSVLQLQPVISISNPTYFSLGNPNLTPSYNHGLSTNFRYANPEKFTNFVFNIYGNYTLDPIGNETSIMDKDTVIHGQTLLQNGQLTSLLNLPDSWNIRSFVNYGFLFKAIKCNINLMLGSGYSTIPGYVNDVLGTTKSVSYMQGIVIASNISEYVDFTVSYNGNATFSRNTIEERLNSNTWNHIIGLGSKLTSKKGFVFGNNFSEQILTGYSSGYDQNYFIWNITLGKKLFKNKNGQIAIQVNDVLDQNKDVSRTVTDFYVADSWSNTIGRYGMLTFTYTFRSYNAKNNPGMRPPGGMDGFDRPPFNRDNFH
ncbi:MAG: TonB-dependent receptor [Bacteroidales bacterium]